MGLRDAPPPVDASRLAPVLAAGLEALGVEADADQQGRLLDYLALLHRWNRVYNLTAVRHPLVMVSQHLLDSASILPYIQGPRLLDVGTGAGLPGIPLAILRPGLEVVMLDANSKKTRFVQQAIAELGLANASVVQARVEDFHPPAGFDTVTARAFAALPDLLDRVHHLCAKGGIVVAMKGPRAGEELAALGEMPAGFSLLGRHALTVPGLDAGRQLILVRAEAGNHNTETGE